MRFDRALGRAVVGPVEDRNLQIDDAIQPHQLVLETELIPRTLRRNVPLTLAEQLP
jgi:hypothetical protein